MEHDVVPLGERHAPHNFEYADETTRLAATITDSKWVNALALQLDDGSYWRVASVSPATWEPVGAAGGTPAWADITGKPSTFPPSTHSHVVSDVTDLQDELDAKQATLVNQVNIKSINGVSLLGAGNMTISGGGGGSSAWADITGTPTTLTGYGITDAEPSITKATGYAKWTGSAWSFSNETYMQTSHDANAVTAAAISNWNAAYEWGDHVSVGYAKRDSINTFTKAQRGSFVTLTDAPTIELDLSLANQYQVVLKGNRILGVPTNIAVGQQGVINAYQDEVGYRTLVPAWCYGTADGVELTLSTAGCTKDMLAYSVDYSSSATVTVTIATPGVVTMPSHGLISGQRCRLSTTGVLPTGLATNTTYFVRVVDANTISLCTTLANAAANTRIATAGSQSGVHTLTACGITLALVKATP